MGAGPQSGDAEPDLAGPESGAAAIPSQRSSGHLNGPSSRYTPLFHAQNDGRYLRREMIKNYQRKHNCRLAVMIDVIDPDQVTHFCELLHDPDPAVDLHLMLRSPGGNGEAAIRLARAAQASFKRLVVLVPDIAKSAATIFALGADEIVMGPTSDLGPIDPQVLVGERGYVSAKEVRSAVDWALSDVANRPETYTLHSALLGAGMVDATTYQFAKSAILGTSEIARQAIACNASRTADEIEALAKLVEDRLISGPALHSAVFGPAEARAVGLPVTELEPQSEWWQDIWGLWTRYFTIAPTEFLSIYESELASQVQILPMGHQ